MPRKQVRKPAPEPMKVVRQYQIQARWAEYVFCPANAIEKAFYQRDASVVPELITMDGTVHRPEFITTWNNRDGIYDDEFENICQKYYETPFESIRSIWIGRLDVLDDFWHLIKLGD